MLISHLLAICFYPVDIDPRTRRAGNRVADDGDAMISIDDYHRRLYTPSPGSIDNAIYLRSLVASIESRTRHRCHDFLSLTQCLSYSYSLSLSPTASFPLFSSDKCEIINSLIVRTRRSIPLLPTVHHASLQTNKKRYLFELIFLLNVVVRRS